jgi:hypothetical protein
VPPRWKLPGPSPALAEMMARDAAAEGRPFGGQGELAAASEPPPPLERPALPPPPWAVEPGLREDHESYPAKRGHHGQEAPC